MIGTIVSHFSSKRHWRDTSIIIILQLKKNETEILDDFPKILQPEGNDPKHMFLTSFCCMQIYEIVRAYCSRVSGLHLPGQISPKVCSSTACELRMMFTDEHLQLIWWWGKLILNPNLVKSYSSEKKSILLISRHAFQNIVLYYIMNSSIKKIGFYSFFLCNCLYNILEFASWPQKPKTFTIWSFY